MPKSLTSWFSSYEQVEIWDAFTGERLMTWRLQGIVMDLTWSPDGSRLATISDAASRLRSVCLWAASNGTLLAQAEIMGASWLRWSKGSDILFVLSDEGILEVLDASTATLLALLRPTTKDVAQAAWSPGEHHLALVPVRERTVYLWDSRAARRRRGT